MSILRVLSLVFCFVFALAAQTSRGTLTGLVTDGTGAAIAGAAVTLTDNQRNTSRNTETNEAGAYRFDAVDPGTFKVDIQRAGFRPFTAQSLTIAAQVVTLDARLEVGSVAESIEVSASSVQLQVEQPVRAASITSVQATELPISSRNPALLALTLPGVSSNRGGFGVATFSVNGGRGRSNNFMLDGTENNDISINGQAFQILIPDAVQETSVQTSNYDAEFGRAGGGVVNTILKSGTDTFHGSAAYLLESTRLNAITNTQGLSSYVVQNQKPIPGTDQWFYGTLGGPIRRGKTFFFAGYLDRRTVQQGTTNLTTLSAAGRQTLRGLFPSGANANVDTYLTATEGVAATSQLSSVSAGPNRPNLEVGTFIRTIPSKKRDFQPIVKIDHRFSDRDALMARFAYDEATDPLATTNFIGMDTPQKTRYQNAAVNWTRVISPAMTNELRLPYNRITLDFPLDPANPLGLTLPNIAIQGMTVVGVNGAIPQGRIANNYGLQDTVSIVRGTHTFRFGGDLLLQRSRQAAPANVRGSVTFNAGGGASAWANFIDNFSGSAANAGRSFGNPVYYPSLFRHAYFFQDRWRATQDLTLTVGLRYEYFGLPMNALIKPAYSGIFNLNPQTFTGPYSEPNQVEPDRNNFSPNIGIAYSPAFQNGWLAKLFGDRASSIRAGYMIGYESFFNNIASNAVASTPNLIATNQPGTVDASNPRGVANWFARIPVTARAASPLDSQTLMLQNLRNPYFQRFSFSIQRKLPKSLLFDIAYVGSRGVRLFINEEMNPLVPLNLRVFPSGTTAANFSGPTQNRFDPLQGDRTTRTNGGSSTYHGLQMEVRRSFSSGLTFSGAYTWSKMLDNASEIFAWGGGLTGSSIAQIPAPFGGQALERGLSAFDRTQRAVFTWVYELPFAKQQRGALGHVLGGWQLAGVATFESGVPFSVVNGLDALGFGGAGTARPDLNPNGQPGVRARVSAASPTGYVNPDAGNAPIDPAQAQFVQLPSCTDPNGCRPGTLGRNTQRSPGIANWNVNLQKSTRVSERLAMQLRGEFFNLWNHPQYGVGNESAFAPGLGILGSNLQATLAGRFLNPTFQDGGGRVLRLQLRLLF